MDFKSLPKIELHLHLDCSLSYNVVKELAPSISEEKYNETFKAPVNCNNLVDYIKRANSAIQIMQSNLQLERVVLDLFEQLKADNVAYAEIRFAPLLHLKGGLTSTMVVEAVDKATRKGIKRTGVQANIILATLRHYTEKQSMETVKLVHDFKGSHVVGFDIAADEAGFPIDNHIKAFEYAQANDLHRTAHAGEACGCESVWETLKHFKPSRIGHGVRSYEDENLVKHLIEHDIHLEVCPTSNTQTGVFPSIKDSTLDSLYREGVSLALNTDGRTISDISLTEEYEKVQEAFKWTLNDFHITNKMAIDASFADEITKNRLHQLIDDGFR